MNTKTANSPPVLPPVPKGLNMPFYYHSLLNCELFFYVEPEILQPYLADTELNLALMDGQGIVTYNFQNYTAQFAAFDSVVLELEIIFWPIPLRASATHLLLPWRSFCAVKTRRS